MAKCLPVVRIFPDPQIVGGEWVEALMASRYGETYAAWQKNPEGFWGEAAREIEVEVVADAAGRAHAPAPG